MTRDPAAPPGLQGTQRAERTKSLKVEELYITARPPSGPEITLACGTAPISVGSAPTNVLVLADPKVSRFHALLVPQDGGLMLRDLGSTNGTFVAGAEIR